MRVAQVGQRAASRSTQQRRVRVGRDAAQELLELRFERDAVGAHHESSCPVVPARACSASLTYCSITSQGSSTSAAWLSIGVPSTTTEKKTFLMCSGSP